MFIENTIFTLFIVFIIHFQILEASKHNYVTCGSVIKLMNTDYRGRLHSHDVKYGTGSGQQSVTTTEVQEDINSHWLVKAATGKTCLRGEPVKCGSPIRLEHVETKKNLHSHHFQSPLSSNQEISCYGDNGEGDSGDNWFVICTGNFSSHDTSPFSTTVAQVKYCDSFTTHDPTPQYSFTGYDCSTILLDIGRGHTRYNIAVRVNRITRVNTWSRTRYYNNKSYCTAAD